jgi:hypothetical protein
VLEKLRTRDVARFVARGFLRFDALVPSPLNERFMQEVERGIPEPSPAGTPLAHCYPGSVVREILALPKVAGLIESLVGPDPLFDHQGVHFNPPASVLEARGLRVLAQHTHQDSIRAGHPPADRERDLDRALSEPARTGEGGLPRWNRHGLPPRPVARR